LKWINFISDNFNAIVLAIAGLFAFWQIAKREGQHKRAKKILKKAIDGKLDEPITLHPEIDPNLCAGCGTCTTACPEGSILSLINHKAVLVAPTKCVGHGECERACPMNAIKLVFGTKTRGMDIPRLTTHYETNVPGLYIAGELGGMGLIRNATKQGFLAASHALKNLEKTKKNDFDLLVVGAGPAGLAASLTAIAHKKSYICLEQNSFGGTVYNFPRQKIVMSHPFELPIVGSKKFESHKVSKETLLKYFNKIRQSTGLKVKENVRFESLTQDTGGFRVKTNTGEFQASKVILAMGVRGTPRRLGVKGEDTEKVTYNLIDPEQYQGCAIVVVGGGNAGLEAAQMLSSMKLKNTVHLFIRGDNFDRANEDNINKIREMAQKGLIDIWFKSSVVEILPAKIIVNHDGKTEELPNHYVFIFAGAEMPHKFLMSLGVDIEKKFGTGLQGA
jgi:thioredoxin reductase/NAD-dependent dihydropyrimidine dehydrogenase PreA subunit